MEGMHGQNAGRIKKTYFTLLANGTKINQMSSEETGGKYETVVGHLP
jgi:hypothetical protein